MDESMATAIRVDPRRAASVLALIVAVVSIAGVLASVLRYYAPDFPGRDTYVLLFELWREETLPNWWSSVQLLIAAALLALIAYGRYVMGRRHVRYWVALALIFLYAAADEAAPIHNRLGNYAPGAEGEIGVGLASIPWVWPAIALVAIVGLAFIPFLRRLPPQTAFLFVIAGGIYLTGALVFEILGVLVLERVGVDTFAGSLTDGLQEVVELIGEVVFIYALLRYAREQLPTVGATT